MRKGLFATVGGIMHYDDVLCELTALTDEKYKAFNARIVNTRLNVYGVRTPVLRALAKRIKKEYPSFADDFFARGEYSFEEVLLCGWQLGKDYNENVRLLKRLIPRMDSWAHTDQVIGKFAWAKDPGRLLADFAYLKSGGEYEVRAYVMLMFATCVTADRLPIIFRELPSVPPGLYYVDMAVAWLICEVVVKFYDDGVKLLSCDYLTPWVVKKAVSKCRDSYRLTPAQKDFLRDFAAAVAENTKITK